MGLPTIEHIIFIPAVLLIGVVLGYIMGSNAAKKAIETKRRRTRE
jgi:hypothetical protein